MHGPGNEGVHDLPRSLHCAALDMETEIGDGNFVPHCLFTCPAVVLAQLGLIPRKEGQDIQSPGGECKRFISPLSKSGL